MTTGLYWYLPYRRGTGDLSQIIVMGRSGDPWLQNTAFKRSGEARPFESAPAHIQRYRAGMIRRTAADPAQAGKKVWVESSAAYALTLDKLWARTGKPPQKSRLPSNHGVFLSNTFPVMGSVRPYEDANYLVNYLLLLFRLLGNLRL